MRSPHRSLAALVAVSVLALTGCGDDSADDGSESASGSGSSATSTPSQNASTPQNGPSSTEEQTPGQTEDDQTEDDQTEDDQTEDDGALEVEIEIEDGSTTPAGQRVQVSPGQTIRLEVDSDIADELHVHADPEHAFEVKAADDQVFEFAIDVPGVYEMESHEIGNQIISIQVQP